MTTLLVWASMMIGLAGFGYQCSENRHVKKELKQVKKDFKEKEEAMNFSYKRADRRRSHESQVDRSRDAAMKNPSDEQARQDYIRDIRGRYK